jgi:hypothetical protein
MVRARAENRCMDGASVDDNVGRGSPAPNGKMEKSKLRHVRPTLY